MELDDEDVVLFDEVCVPLEEELSVPLVVDELLVLLEEVSVSLELGGGAQPAPVLEELSVVLVEDELLVLFVPVVLLVSDDEDEELLVSLEDELSLPDVDEVFPVPVVLDEELPVVVFDVLFVPVVLLVPDVEDVELLELVLLLEELSVVLVEDELLEGGQSAAPDIGCHPVGSSDGEVLDLGADSLGWGAIGARLVLDFDEVVFEVELGAGAGAVVGPLLDEDRGGSVVVDSPLESSPAPRPPMHPGSPAARTRLTTTPINRIAILSDPVHQKGTDVGLSLRMAFLGQGWKTKRRRAGLAARPTGVPVAT